jgi:hypothetical protein
MIERNLNALADDPMQDIYRAFVGYFQDENRQGDLWEQAL